MSQVSDAKVTVVTTGPKLPEGVLAHDAVPQDSQPGWRVFVHYNGPTDQLMGVCTGMCVLDPGAAPHPPHRHPEEEFLMITEGTGEIECDGKVTQVGPGAIMYCAANTLHGVLNTGLVPMTFYWSKWIGRS